jgi:hypothetical protein
MGGGRRRLRVVREAPEAEEFVGRLVKLGTSPSRHIAAAIDRWVSRALRRELDRQRDAFIAATAAEADGVSLVVTVKSPPALAAIAPLLRGGPPKPADLAALRGIAGLLRGSPDGTLTITAGPVGG